MSAIDEKIKKLKEQEKQLEREKRKIEFLNHILTSAKDFSDTDFTEVKSDVVALLDKFVTASIKSIENGTELVFDSPKKETPSVAPVAPQQNTLTPRKVTGPSPAELMDFALNHRHLGGKIVSVMNDKNITINGKVVGLEAPFVLVKTDTGPVIKVPVDKVSLK